MKERKKSNKQKNKKRQQKTTKKKKKEEKRTKKEKKKRKKKEKKKEQLMVTNSYSAPDKVEMHMGGMGIHSVASDYTTILHALLNGGVGANGKRILEEKTVDLLFEDQAPNLKINVPAVGLPYKNLPADIRAGWSFGGMVLHNDLATGR